MKKALLCLASALLFACASDLTDPAGPDGPFAVDSGAVLVANFNGDTVNRVTESTGTVQAGLFVPALFDSGVRIRENPTGKYGVDFPNTEAFSLRSGIEGSLEALVRADS